ncbi:zinc transporter ZupT [Corynebacterium yudongzhengii]|uniref:Zinc transporter ZupT n=1 Tax=Corynebacterium yudongzhengii TaxID=2080740 RepID=A0A2U1T3Y6_9CORY|nr:zinc transporter ZupT [Corynebacterium yudongzhengii]AWB82180.1 zinc transporter ZupT [Corynebacterium yudongzhengii]PWC00717.1 zinc transporter ZupT [Corynebacterium yudongzhengii]
MTFDYDLPTILLAFGLTLLAGLSTGIGGAIGVAHRRPGPGFLAAALGFSAGVMVLVSFVEILPKATEHLGESFGGAGGWLAYGAFFAGIVLIAVIDFLVPNEINPHAAGAVSGASSYQRRSAMMKTGMLTAVALALHNFPEGFATFIASLTDVGIALPILVAIAIHNIPEGVAVAVPLREATGSRMKAFSLATLSGLAEPAGALIGFAILAPILGDATLGISFAAIAGIMVFVSLDKLLPTAVSTGRHHTAIYGLIVGMAVMALSLLILE